MSRLLLLPAALATFAAAKDTGADTVVGADPTAVDLGGPTDPTPVNVESGDDDLADIVAGKSFSADQADATLTDLVEIDVKLRAEGLSLAEVLYTTIKNVTGCDVR